MILAALGSNLNSDRLGPPQAVCAAALDALAAHGVSAVRVSRWYRSEPVPPSAQPWYVNGVAALKTTLDPVTLLALMHRIEADFGRMRRERNEARVIDLDLLAFHDRVRTGPDAPILPHPRLTERAFVLLPLADVAPDWVHPVTGLGIDALIRALPPGQRIEPIMDEGSIGDAGR